jgi:DNA topoisomerase-2
MSDDDFAFSDDGYSDGSVDDGSFEEEKPKAPKKASAKKVADAPAPKKAAAKKAAPSSASAVMDVDEVATKPAAPSRSKTIEETYTKMEQHDHVLSRPDMYIGSTRRVTEELWVWDPALSCMVQKTITYSPGLYKIFDEVLVNAADNFQKDTTMRYIKVDINQETGVISVFNDGKGIPIEIHKDQKKYVPEMIFGELLTGSSFDDTESKVTGGRNGLGAKLANIYSQEFIVECRCQGRQFKQVFKRNMFERSPAEVYSVKGSDYTKISFKPDFKRFDGMDRLDDDIISLFMKRVIDVAGCNSKLNVQLNGSSIEIKSFKDYVGLYFKANEDAPVAEIIGPEVITDATGRKRWEVAFAVSNGDFQQVSFVNSIWTIRGGSHVAAVVKKITDMLQPKVSRKNKGTEVKPAMIRNHMFVFVNSLLYNPEFDSQTKETLKSTQNMWGTKPDLSEAFLNKIATKSGIVEQILSWNQGRSAKVLQTTGGKKRGRLGISKLTEANMAATSKAHMCTLIVTEGDSAKGLALAGLSVVGRDHYGIFPLRGKVLNVRDATLKKVVANEELNMIKKAMGLQHDKNYTDVSSLRYGRIMIMTDQDHDGSHIKGLFINFIHHYWPSLAKIPGFLCEFITPIVKVTKGDRTHAFFTIPQYQEWCAQNNTRGWTIKYYKGLGTSEPAEMQEYFGDLPKHKKDFRYVGPQDDEAIKMAFSKANADQRKEWLAGYQPGTHLDQALTKIPYHEFINKELILFSLEDCERSIASMMDGFKPGQRKIMFACFKRNLKGEIKIAQLAGYVLEHCAYHHGEVSLYSTMIGMAQNFVGSNNLNLLEPVGNFGSRDQGGKDAAAARYIFTTLSPLTRYIFHPDDDDVLEYMEDEGMQIQPNFYCPVLPMLLVNGNAGIGTGWSSSVPNYNPRDVVANLRRLLKNEEVKPMQPWYRGFQGEINYNEKKGNYTCHGVWRRLDNDSIEITELPIGTWTQGYKDSLEAMILANEKVEKKEKKAAERTDAKKKAKKGEDDEEEEFGAKKKKEKDDEPTVRTFSGVTIKDFKEYHTTTRVHFVVFSPDFANMDDAAIEKAMKLTDTISITNMHLFDAEGRIKKYPTPEDILKEFFIVRYAMYQKRKDWIVDQIAKDLKVLDNKMRFIKEVIEKTLIVANRKKAELFNELRKKGYDPIPKNALKKKVSNDGVELLPQGVERHEGDEDEDLEAAAVEEEDAGTRDYDYLLSMAIWSLTWERYKKLMEQQADKQKELAAMKAVHPADLWERDLDAFMDAWTRYETNMTILDECGVGGCAFRKPTLQAKVTGGGGGDKASRASTAKREATREAFKRLQKLAPVKVAQPPPKPHPERAEIVLPEVNHDHIIPPPKVKKEDPAGTPKAKRASAKATGKGSILSYMKPEPVIKTLTEEEILALPLSERLALRARSSAPSSSPGKTMTLDDLVGDDSDEDAAATTSKKAKKPRISTTLIDLSESDQKPKTKKPKTASSKKASASRSFEMDSDEDDDEVAMFDDDAPAVSRPKTKRASASRASTRMQVDSDTDSDLIMSDSEVAPKRAKATRAKNADDSDDSFGGAVSDSDSDVVPVKKLAAKPATAKVASATATAKVTAKTATSSAKAASSAAAPKRAKAAAAAKKSKAIDIDSDLDISMEDSDAGSDDEAPKTARPKRARAPAAAAARLKNLVESDSDDIQLDSDSDF